MKKKFYFILAIVASATIASCTSDEYVGENPGTGSNDAITFGSGFKAITRAELSGEDAAKKLGNAFKIYGVKQDKTTITNYNNVFVNYTVKYNEAQAGKADYNDGWYYVGAETNQFIKYWDYSSACYHFVAGSPVANFTYAVDETTKDIKTATITGLGGRLDHSNTVASTQAAVYVAEPKVVAKADYNKEVNFTFKTMQSKVRVGIYETIPGYKISSITFYNNATTPVGSNYITLNSATDNYFQGGSGVGGKITYSWGTTPSNTFTYNDEDGEGDNNKAVNTQKFWEGGQFSSGVPAVSSTGTVADLYGTETNKDANGYFIVMPITAATAVPLSITCDYTLESLDGSGENIEISGAATIPADYTKWEPNKAYTYLFKISDSNLHPITFDAVVINEMDNLVGTTTTISTPSITVYQDGNVVTNGITYKAGDITVKAMEGTTDVTGTATWSYCTISGTTFDFTKDYEHLGASGATTSWTSGGLTSVTTGNTYVIKAVTSNGTAYFVLVVGAAETGPTNTTTT